MVTTNVNTINQLDLKEETPTLEQVLAGSILSTRGTVLFGNNTTQEDKKVQLEIFYTEPEN